MSRRFLTPILLPGNPTQALEAAPKQYVDTMNEVVISTTDPIGSSPLTELWFDTDAVATADPPVPWIAASLVNSWVSYGGFQAAQYRKVGDIVAVRGLVSGGAAGSTVFTLPVGYRPPGNLLFPCDTNPSAHGRLNVNTTGIVFFESASTGQSAYGSLSSISFSVTA